ncbi:hypothetical protein FC19_GL002258 [Liquorilactobacillus aquaticus DSM 21051]|uniref:HTH tetR-type domain-containing protein n=1 Tax=Liquorilactobacillus aquaticus DSM 21051 TaxID=1423725 RepID=A0A0R2D452_9LACO|nr:TetR/AcrR family transcriptional regulator [Liquorilactobacillus aquaticus]KRM95163.1 hypothetical protein FC19_GL002258 [Liquorilactobacillus aquaticus DSM 21051]
MSDKKQYTKIKILQTALEDIDKNGYEELSLRKLANNCGLTTGAFYKHFASKDELFMSLMLKLSVSLTENINLKSNEQYTPREELLHLGQNIFALFKEKTNLVDFLFFNPVAQSVYKQSSEVQNAFPLLRSVRTLINELIDYESLELDSTETFIKIWAFLQGYMLLVRNGVTEFDVTLLSATLNSLLRKDN